MSTSNNRHTQLGVLSLADEAKSTIQTAKRDGVKNPSADRSDPNSNLNKRKERFLEDASDTTTGVRQAKKESPWTKYEEVFSVELGGPIKVAIQKAPTIKLVSVRVFPAPAAEKALHMFRRVQHRNIVAALDAFTTDDGFYIVLEHMPVPLEWIVRSPADPNEQQLAAILGQILDGVAYLAAQGLEHGALCCSDILLNTDGDVKIGKSILQFSYHELTHLANPNSCNLKAEGSVRDLRALSSITMELMQKYTKEDGAVGIDDLHRWHSNSDAVGFLSATTSVGSAAELRKHPLLSHPLRKESLIGIISLAQVCTRGRYKYSPQV
ncbi:hypothetical protein CC78DRAFT_551976 [Lojkania enalia]|uniref:Protein kinase domain-containing protein n=1 Tax=Lojkania enalia TaxID=147567 RepID=A0A9P4KGJ2_9PLEO|nr:hypothetical protein CC78DRAFT_551976 [Didymosphaeria enalia]